MMSFVRRVRDEVRAGKPDGSVDMVWINGENFAAMKSAGLLFGPFAESLPNWPLVDTTGKPATVTDFTLPTEGHESPWAMAQLVFEYDSARVPEPPRSLTALGLDAALTTTLLDEAADVRDQLLHRRRELQLADIETELTAIRGRLDQLQRALTSSS